MRLFEFMEVPQLQAAIKKIEATLVANVASISNPAQGSLSYRSQKETLATLRALKNRLAERTGGKPDYDMPRAVRQTVRGDD